MRGRKRITVHHNALEKNIDHDISNTGQVNRIIIHVNGRFKSILYRSKSNINKNEEEILGKNCIKTMLQYELQNKNFFNAFDYLLLL